METTIPGENHLIRIALQQSDESALLIADVSEIIAKIMQKGKVLAKYTLGTDAEIRQGTTTSEVEIEIKSTLSRKFVRGEIVTVQLITQVEDEEFEVDGMHRDITEIEVFTC